MKPLIILLAFCLPCLAQVPVDPKAEDFQSLLKHSPFKVAKAVPPPTIVKPLNTNYTLRGVSRFDDGWRVTLIDAKNPTSRVRVYENQSNNAEGIRLLRVLQNTEDLFKTTVELMVGGRKITVGYNSAELKKRRASSVKSKPVPKMPNQPVTTANSNPPLPHQVDSANNQNAKSVRRPRVRRVVPAQQPSN